MTVAELTALLERVATAWSTQDTELALSCFTEDAVYMEPPDIQIYSGHEQLRPCFAALGSGTLMQFHNVLLDESGRVGAGEYTFGSVDDPVADHGVAIVELADDRIARWREYQRKGPALFSEFAATSGKSWQWHIGNYP